MTTRGDMITEMSSDMGRSNAAALAAMSSKISAAVRYYQNNRFWFNESASVTFNTVIATYTYSYTTIGTELYKIDGVFITTAAISPVELVYMSPDEIQGLLLEDTSNGQPTNWSFFNEAVWFYPRPDAVFAIELMGHVKIAAPASDSEAGNPWMNNAYDLIMCHAKAELYAHRWEDPAQAAVMAKAESMWLNSLQGETADKTRSGFVEATDF